MNQLHSNQDRMHKKRQLGVPIIGGGAPGAGSATPTATRETVPVAPSSTPVAAAPSTRALPDPVTLPSSTPVVATRPPATTAVVPSSTVVVPVASSTIASTASLLTTSAPLTVTVPARSSSSFASVVTSTSLSLTVVSGGTQAFSSGTLPLASSSSSSLLPTATSASTRSSSTGITTGGIIGIIAGALVGVVVLATFIGFCVKRAKKNRVDDDHVFNKDDFRRESVLLEDEQEGNQMTEYAPSSLSRGNTSLPGGGGRGPRPPSMILNHYQAQQMQPSYQPGQIFQHSPTFNGHSAYPQGNPGMDLYGGYPTSPTQQQSLDRGLFGVQDPSPPPMAAQQRYSPPHLNPFAAQSINGSQLARNGSNVSAFSTSRPQPPVFYEADDRERREAEGQSISHIAEAGSRSGTPVNSNVQQSYFSHGHTESASSDTDPNHANRPFGKQNSSFTRLQPVETGYGQARGLTSPVLTLPGERSPVGDAFDPNTSRAQRTLSVRNGDGNGRVDGKTDSVASDGYGGYA